MNGHIQDVYITFHSFPIRALTVVARGESSLPRNLRMNAGSFLCKAPYKNKGWVAQSIVVAGFRVTEIHERSTGGETVHYGVRRPWPRYG
jgi:hypothetical protein